MNLKLSFRAHVCMPSMFIINGGNASCSDFGTQRDCDEENAEDYSCGDMRFIRKDPTMEVLDLYNISEKDYDEIAEKLTEGLSFGECGWCA